jgi:hypothetical protein
VQQRRLPQASENHISLLVHTASSFSSTSSFLVGGISNNNGVIITFTLFLCMSFSRHFSGPWGQQSASASMAVVGGGGEAQKRPGSSPATPGRKGEEE